MSKSKLEFITDREGNKKKVVVPIKLWDKLMDDLENIEDQLLALKATIKKDPKYIPFEEVEKRISAKHAS